MPAINVLSREISELIAAGEVIERPSSVIKELVENSIDAGSETITVEIKHGGSTFIRITDDGCGISYDDVPKAFLRHATSKVLTKEDLGSILTLGFRGEALASVCAVAKAEIMTKQREDDLGTHYIIEGSEEVLHEQSGCPDGTTIIIRDLFYNVPARQKFMKKDSVEGSMVCSIVSRIALSHPEIAFKMIRDNKIEFSTAGDGNLYSSVFAVFGKAFANDLIPVDYEQDGIHISGYCIKPLYSKGNRSFQNYFVNKRYVKSQVCTSAVEEAYKGTVMTGKFPACVLMVDIAPDTVDVNVHPAKVEIRFSDEKPIYNCIYFAVKSALMNSGLIYDFQLKPPVQNAVSDEKYEQPLLPSGPEDPKEDKKECRSFDDSSNSSVSVSDYKEADKNEYEKRSVPNEIPEYKTDIISEPEVKEKPVSVSQPSVKPQTVMPERRTEHVSSGTVALAAGNSRSSGTVFITEPAPPPPVKTQEIQKPVIERQVKQEELSSFTYINQNSFKREEKKTPVEEPEKKKETVIRYIGEAFHGYVLAEIDEKLVIVDKHAAHERIIFERLKAQNTDPASQFTLDSEGILLTLDEAQALSDNVPRLEKMGFSLDLSKSPYVYVRAVPSIISHLNMDELIPEVADNLRRNKLDPRPEAIDDILHTMACKAAIKMNDKNSPMELESLVREVYENEAIRHCPHGRPVMFMLSKYELEKQFRRIV